MSYLIEGDLRDVVVREEAGICLSKHWVICRATLSVQLEKMCNLSTIKNYVINEYIQMNCRLKKIQM